MKALIVDDEALARRGLELRLAEYDDVEVCGQSRNGREAVAHCRDLLPDVMFLDVQMPGMNGFDVIRTLRHDERMPLVVFVTAYDRYAIDAFEAHAMDYLLKPLDVERLAQAVERVRGQLARTLALRQRESMLKLLHDLGAPEDAVTAEGGAGASPWLEVLSIKDRGKISRVPVRSIESIEAARDYLCVHAQGETYVLRGTMKKIETRLDPSLFQRVHRSTIVNVSRVKSLRPHINGEYFLSISGGREVKLSRTYREKLRYFMCAS